jgi:hypothetical protein
LAAVAVLGVSFLLFTHQRDVQAAGNQDAYGAGLVTVYRKQVIQSASAGTTPTSAQIESASCPAGSVLVGLNFENIGKHYSRFADVYCRAVTSGTALGPVTAVRKTPGENPWGHGTPTSAQIESASCPAGSALVGFSLDSVAGASSAWFYCRAAGAGAPQVNLRTIVQNPWGGTLSPNDAQVGGASCPAGHAVGGFNMANLGNNYAVDNNLYCRPVAGLLPTPPPAPSPPSPAGVLQVVCRPAAVADPKVAPESGDFRGDLKNEGKATTAALGDSREFAIECWGVNEKGERVTEKATDTVKAAVLEPPPPMPTFAPLDYFSLTNSSDITVVRGGVALNTITVVKGKDAYQGVVYLATSTVLSLGTHGVGAFRPSVVRVGEKSEFSVSADWDAPLGTQAVIVTGKTPPVLGGSCTTTHTEKGNDIACTSVFRKASLQLSSGNRVSFPGASEFYGKFADAVCGVTNWTTVKGSSPVLLGQNGGVGSFSCTDLAKTQVAKTTTFKVTVTERRGGEECTPGKDCFCDLHPTDAACTTKMWDGWIKLSGKAKDGSPYGVKYDPKTTRFCGYAWGGEVVGWIKFGPLPSEIPGAQSDWICDRTVIKDAKGNVVSAPPYRVIPGSPSGNWVRLESAPIQPDIKTVPITDPILNPYDGIIANKSYRLTGWAWSSNIGWIQMGANPLGTCKTDGMVDGVVCMAGSVPLAQERKFVGWAWSSNIGWVKFDAEPFGREVRPAAPDRASYLNIGANLLEGWARVCSATINGDCNSATGEYRGQ